MENKTEDILDIWMESLMRNYKDPRHVAIISNKWKGVKWKGFINATSCGRMDHNWYKYYYRKGNILYLKSSAGGYMVEVEDSIVKDISRGWYEIQCIF